MVDYFRQAALVDNFVTENFDSITPQENLERYKNIEDDG